MPPDPHLDDLRRLAVDRAALEEATFVVPGGGTVDIVVSLVDPDGLSLGDEATRSSIATHLAARINEQPERPMATRSSGSSRARSETATKRLPRIEPAKRGVRSNRVDGPISSSSRSRLPLMTTRSCLARKAVGAAPSTRLPAHGGTGA
jgi:hypothetical protein